MDWGEARPRSMCAACYCGIMSHCPHSSVGGDTLWVIHWTEASNSIHHLSWCMAIDLSNAFTIANGNSMTNNSTKLALLDACYTLANSILPSLSSCNGYWPLPFIDCLLGGLFLKGGEAPASQIIVDNFNPFKTFVTTSKSWNAS